MKKGKVNPAAQAEGFTVRVRLHPRSSREAVRRGEGGSLEAWVTAPPVDGEANAALQRLLAHTFGAAAGRVVFLSGERSREKRLLFLGLGREEGEAVLARLPGGDE